MWQPVKFSPSKGGYKNKSHKTIDVHNLPLGLHTLLNTHKEISFYEFIEKNFHVSKFWMCVVLCYIFHIYEYWIVLIMCNIMKNVFRFHVYTYHTSKIQYLQCILLRGIKKSGLIVQGAIAGLVTFYSMVFSSKSFNASRGKVFLYAAYHKRIHCSIAVRK